MNTETRPRRVSHYVPDGGVMMRMTQVGVAGSKARRMGQWAVRVLALAGVAAAVLGAATDRRPLPAAAAEPIIGYGVNGGEGRLDVVTGMGFNWIKLTASWKSLQSARGQFSWANLDGRIDRARAKGLKMLLRVDDPPEWASSKPGSFNAPPANNGDLATLMGAMAARYKGKVAGYEIWNEPNLNYEWGLTDPDPVRYGEMVKALYPAVKAADPAALVVTGGLSTAGDGASGPYLGDLFFLSKLIDPNRDGVADDGYLNYFDVIGSHPYGGPYPAATPPDVARNDIGTYFRRAEEQHDTVFLESKVDKPVWATEFGWLIDPAALGLNCPLDDHFTKLKGSADFQAQQLVGAYQYAAANWPWMGPMFLFNLDMSMDNFRQQCDQVRFFSILKADGNPLPAYTALQAMPKVGAVAPPPATPTATPPPARQPNQPLAIGPVGGATLPNLGPTLTWDTPAGATQVHLQVIPSNNDGPGVNLIVSATSSFAIPAPPAWYGMLPGMGYSWRVRSTNKATAADENDSAWGPWSVSATFRTPAPDPARIVLVAPAANATVANRTPTLTWSSGDPALFYYEVQLSRDAQFVTDSAKATASVYQNLVHGAVSTPRNSYVVPANAQLEAGAMYFWRVRPRVQGDGTPVGWTTTRMFVTPGGSVVPTAQPTPAPTAAPSAPPTPARTAVPSPSPSGGGGAVTFSSLDGTTYLMGADSGGKYVQYLGDVSSNCYASNSIMNDYGNYGSSYSSTSIRNEYGQWGSPYNSRSATNPNASSPPFIVKKSDDSVVTYLTENSALPRAATYALLGYLKSTGRC